MVNKILNKGNIVQKKSKLTRVSPTILLPDFFLDSHARQFSLFFRVALAAFFL
jgi:hypothetical protein